jgi:hypothetical protein
MFPWGTFSDEKTVLQFAVQLLNGPSLAEPVAILYCLAWDSSNLEGQDQGGPVIPPGIGYPLCHLLRLAGLWWRYSNPPPTLWLTKSKSKAKSKAKSKSKLLYNLQSVSMSWYR